METRFTPETVASLKKMGLSNTQIEELDLIVNGQFDPNTPKFYNFIPDKGDTLFTKNMGYEIEYLNLPQKELLERGLVDPKRIKKLQKNFVLLQERKVGFEYAYGSYLTNIDDYAYRKMDIRTLGLDFIPAWRYTRDDANRRAGIMDLGCILIGMQDNQFSNAEIKEMKKLLSKMKMQHSNLNADPEILANAEKLNSIFNSHRKVTEYLKDEVTIHEDQDCHTLYLVSGGFHPKGQRGGWQELSHTGGHKITVEVENIKGKIST